MSKFSPEPIEQGQYSVNGNKITVTKFRDNYVTYIDSNDQRFEHVNSFKWNSLHAKEISETSKETDFDNNWESDKSKSANSLNSNKSKGNTTTSFVFEYDDATGTFTIKKDGKPIIEPWVIKGTNGEPGKSAYEEWAKGHRGNFNDFIKSLKGGDGFNGKNGASAFELWLEKQNPEHPGNIDDFFLSLKGKNGENGKNGASAYEVWKTQGNSGNEKTFFDFLKGVNGKNGENGASAYDLWFEKNKQGDVDDFLASLKGADGKDCLDGISAYKIWLKEGHKGDEEDFLKWIQDARKGEQGERGDTYIPHYDERGYLYFRNKDGEKTHPERVKGDEGQIGPRGKEGKSAYEVWLGNGYIGTQQEYIDSLKGKDGFVPPPPKYGYKDVMDFHLPDIKVNPRLISSSDNLTDTRTPEQILNERIEEINSKREQGKEKGCDWFKEFAFWCASADKPLLRMCPGDHAKYVGIGTVILFTALMATFSGFIAFTCVKNIWWLCLLFAIFWGSMFFFLDRFITSTMHSDGKASLFVSGLPRIIISVFLGIVVSAPLELMIFDKEIRTKIEFLEGEEIRKAAIDLKQLKYLKNKDLDNDLKQISIIENNNTSNDNVNSQIETENRTFNETRKTIDGKSKYPERPSSSKEENPSLWKLYQDQCDDIDAKRKQAKDDEQQHHNNEMVRLESLKKSETSKSSLNIIIDSLQSDIKQIEKNIKTEEDSAKAEYDRNKFGLGNKLKAVHAVAMQDYRPWFLKKDSKEGKSNTNTSKLVVNSDSIANESTAKTNFKDEVISKLNNPQDSFIDKLLLHRLWYFLFFSPIGLIMLLLILVDVSPVLYRMLLADGLYDNYQYQEKIIDQYKNRLNLLKAYEKVDESKLKKIAPFIFGNEYKDFVKSLKEYNNSILSEKTPDYTDVEIQKKNQKLFDEVLDMKRRIILATYRRWYKTQHDAIIGDPADDDNRGKEPFEEAEVNNGPTNPGFSNN